MISARKIKYKFKKGTARKGTARKGTARKRTARKESARKNIHQNQQSSSNIELEENKEPEDLFQNPSNLEPPTSIYFLYDNNIYRFQR